MQLAIKGPKVAHGRARRPVRQRADGRLWLCFAVLAAWTTWAMTEYVRQQTEQVKMGHKLEELTGERTENEKALSNLGSEVQKYQSNTRYIENAIRTFNLDLKGNTQANVVKVDAYGNVLRPTPTSGGVFVEATR
jgi:septal ring factor EnvC (AmiA/AmiB activator)